MRRLSFQCSRGGAAQLGGAPGLQKGRHSKDVEEAVVPWMSGQIGELGGSTLLQVSENGGRWAITFIGCSLELLGKQREMSGWCTVDRPF